jgi:prepilin-type N-terminal cleavage/methylation domain-containing protein
MAERTARTRAFTLIELMITVSIIGILAALALPAFKSYANRAKTAEVPPNLNAMFQGAASYYAGDWGAKGMGAGVASGCTIGDAAASPMTPGKDKRRFTGDPNFNAIHFTIADFVYFSYSVGSADVNGACGHGKSSGTLFTFYASGDLNGDGRPSLFQLAAGSDDKNVLYHARGLYIENELE